MHGSIRASLECMVTLWSVHLSLSIVVDGDIKTDDDSWLLYSHLTMSNVVTGDIKTDEGSWFLSFHLTMSNVVNDNIKTDEYIASILSWVMY